MWTEPLEFGKLTWPEVARAAGEGRVPIVPIGTLEDHGYHLPIDTDVTLVEAVCRGAAERLPARDGAPAADSARLFAAPHGFSGHHLDPLGHLLPLLHRRRPVAGAPRLSSGC